MHTLAISITSVLFYHNIMYIAITIRRCYNTYEVIYMPKAKERFGTNLPVELIEKLKEYSKKTMIPMSKIIEKAIEEYLKSAK